jgi:DNA invertase Pin-like site-specific DNA recombinase
VLAPVAAPWVQNLKATDGKIVAEFVETERGKRNDWPKLAEALRNSEPCGARLIIAKLDRLARNVAVISSLLESKAEFVAVDAP